MTAPYPINVNIPNAPNNPADDQPIMKQNYANISGFLGVDHIAPGTATTAGIHNQVRLPNQASPGFAPGAGVLFANLASGQSWPFWTNASGTFQLAGGGTTAAQGSYSIPGGPIIKWGSFAAASSGTVTFPTAFPNNAFSLVFGTLRDGNTGANNVYATSFSKTKFDWNCSSSSHFITFYYIAIGN